MLAALLPATAGGAVSAARAAALFANFRPLWVRWALQRPGEALPAILDALAASGGAGGTGPSGGPSGARAPPAGAAGSGVPPSFSSGGHAVALGLFDARVDELMWQPPEEGDSGEGGAGPAVVRGGAPGEHR